MADDKVPPADPAPPDDAPPPRARPAYLGRKYGLGLPLVLMALLGLLLLGLDSAIGHRLLADWLESGESDIGLGVSIGRIDGSIYGTAQLEDVALRDPQGIFLRVPVVELEWHPLAWLDNRLDIRKLVLHRGVMLRAPRFRTPSVTGPLLPDFDVRLDRFAIDHLTLASAVLGSERRIDLHARAELRVRRAYLSVQGKFGGGDRLIALIDDDRVHDRFALGLDYAAPKGGLLATLTGARSDRRVRIGGTGNWHLWRGGLLADGGGPAESGPHADTAVHRAAALQIIEREGHFALAGLVWSAPLTDPATSRMLGEKIALSAHATLADRRLSGSLEASSATLHLSGRGEADLGAGAFHQLGFSAETRGSVPLGGGLLDGGRATLSLDGPFASFSAPISLCAARWASPGTRIEAPCAKGVASRWASGANTGWYLPLNLSAARIVTGNTLLDQRLIGARAKGTALLTGSHLAISDIVLSSPALAARLALAGDTLSGAYSLSGHLASNGWQWPNLGHGDGEASLSARWSGEGKWSFAAKIGGQLDHITNSALAQLAGERLTLAGEASGGAGVPITLSHLSLNGEHLSLTASGHRNEDGTAELSGSGHHAALGAFTLAARLAADGPHASLFLPDPYPTGGVRAVTLALAPASDGLRIDAQGQSLFGPFAGALALVDGGQSAGGQSAGGQSGADRIDIHAFTISNTTLSCSIGLPEAGAQGVLKLSGGGVSGTISLAPRGGGQGMDVALAMSNATFGGDQPLTIARGAIKASGVLLRHHSTLEGSIVAQGIGKGRLFLGQLAANARLDDGVGHISASLSGRRGSRFELQLAGDLAPDQVALSGHGIFAGQAIAMPRRALFTARSEAEGGGWRMEPSQIDFGTGRAIASGVLGNGTQELNLALAAMPLSLGDVVFADLGLGGLVSGTLHYASPREGLPSGELRVMVKGLTRSGLVVSSRPIDLALVGRLAADRLETRAIASEGAQAIGRLQASITALPPSGLVPDRLRAGQLFAQMRYQGPADAPWRLMGLDDFDLTGPIAIAADISGSLDAPKIQGSLSSDALHLQSADTGTDISQISTRGGFAGSRLSFATLSGHTAGGGQVSGSGSIDFAGITDDHRPAIDLTLSVHKALLASRADMALTATGPMRVISDGLNGTIAGRLSVDSARWRLGLGEVAAELPNIATHEINRSTDVAPASVRHTTWRFLVDLAGRSKIRLNGLGLDSEWGADLRLRGPLQSPTLDGHADLVSGIYEFAGARFDLTRGRIIFTDSTSPDPRLDIAATANITGLAATLNVHGTSLKPQISFSSVPPMPEEEVLSRLLFGDAATKISAPEALQLGAALTTLHGGGGLDPINKVRSVIGLDRLRIVGPDPTIGRQTGVAAGKYFGHKFYAEVVSDGRGYSATDLEFRVSRWLSLLGTVSTIGQQGVNVRVSKDY